MSAINPASFVTPTAGLQPPNGAGPGALGYGRESPSERRRHHEYKPYGLSQAQTSPAGFGDSFDTNRDIGASQVGGLRSPYMDPYQSFGPAIRQPGMGLSGFPQGLQPQADPFSTYPPTSYGMLDPGLSDYAVAAGPGGQTVRRAHPANGDWMNNLQGLSLGS